jgi:hypothetical protein
MKYEVIKEDGVEVDGAEFACGEQIDVDPEVIDVSELLAEGSLAVVDEDVADDVVAESAVDDTVEDDAIEAAGDQTMDETPEDAIAEEVTESGLSYEGKKLVGEVTEEEFEGRVYKNFTVETGEAYKLPADEFEQQVR